MDSKFVKLRESLIWKTLKVVKNRKAGPGGWDRFVMKIRRMFGSEKILCDSCKYDWRGACRHPERPNAVWCPDYEKRG